MTLTEFHHHLRTLANQCYVRYYLHMIPGRIVLEVLVADYRRPMDIDAELAKLGFERMGRVQSYGALYCYRWSVAREMEDAP